MGAGTERPRAWSRRLTPTGVFLAAAVALSAALCIYPAATLLRGSLFSGSISDPGPATLQNYVSVYGDGATYALFGTTLVYAVGTAVAAVVVGLVVAWIAVRTNAPLARHMGWLVFATYALPGTLTSIAWILLANPNTGLLNELARSVLGPDATLFNVYSFLGMLFVSVGHSYALAFAFLAASLHSTDPSLEEAAGTSGARPLTVFWRVNLPLAWPALLSTATILVILGLESFDVPAFVGIPANVRVFSTQIFVETSVRTPPDFGRAATYGVLPLLVALGLTLVYQRSIVAPERYATIRGKAFRPRRLDLGRWRWPATGVFLVVFFVTALLPVATLVLVSLAPTLSEATSFDVRTFGLGNYATILGDPVAQRAIRNTLILAALGATAAMLLAFGVALASLRTRLRGRGLVEYAIFLPFAVPSVVLAVGILWGYVSFPIGVYGTIFILLIGYVTKFMPYGLRSASTSLLQIHPELEEQARVAGASLGQTIRRVVMPLILPGFVAGWTLLAVVFMREFSMSILLWSSGSEVVTVLFFDYWTNGRFGLVAALGLLLIAVSLAVVFAVRRVSRVDTVAA
ncbi:MAG: iron ABC transporter permease [Chloroflexota bacterium]|nr:iron ABC transporter permease [Chloroflexota bacterium]